MRAGSAPRRLARFAAGFAPSSSRVSLAGNSPRDSRPARPQATETIELPPNTVLFRQGDPSDSGIYIVVEGTVGVYVQARPPAPRGPLSLPPAAAAPSRARAPARPLPARLRRTRPLPASKPRLTNPSPTLLVTIPHRAPGGRRQQPAGGPPAPHQHAPRGGVRRRRRRRRQRQPLRQLHLPRARRARRRRLERALPGLRPAPPKSAPAVPPAGHRPPLARHFPRAHRRDPCPAPVRRGSHGSCVWKRLRRAHGRRRAPPLRSLPPTRRRRVAHFVLADFLGLPRYMQARPRPPSASLPPAHRRGVFSCRRRSPAQSLSVLTCVGIGPAPQPPPARRSAPPRAPRTTSPAPTPPAPRRPSAPSSSSTPRPSPPWGRRLRSARTSRCTWTGPQRTTSTSSPPAASAPTPCRGPPARASRPRRSRPLRSSARRASSPGRRAGRRSERTGRRRSSPSARRSSRRGGRRCCLFPSRTLASAALRCAALHGQQRLHRLPPSSL